MLNRSTISHLTRLALFLACWLGGLVCPASPSAAPQQQEARILVGHSPTIQGTLVLVAAALHEQVALLPAVPQVPGVLAPDAVPTTWLAWPAPAWPSAAGPLAAVRPCAVPDMFRVRLLLTAVVPNAP